MTLLSCAGVAKAELVWAEVDSGRLVRADNNGGNQQVLASGSDLLWAVSHDNLADQYYFTSYSLGSDLASIERVNADGSGRTLIHTFGSGMAMQLALDPQNSLIYYTFVDGSDSEIMRMTYDGGDITSLVDAQAATADGIGLDTAGGTIYWIGQTGVIQKAPIGGGTAETVITWSGADLSLDLVNDQIYYGASSGNQLRRVDLDGSNDSQLLSLSETPLTARNPACPAPNLFAGLNQLVVQPLMIPLLMIMKKKRLDAVAK